jgi:ferredoxin-NADP reductase
MKVFTAETELPLWDCETQALVCVGTHDETADVKTFFFRAAAPARFAYQPGQFLTFFPVIDGVEVERCYTIAASPARPHLISITVKRQPGGIVSPWLHEHMRAGVSIRANGPLGIFSCVQHPAEKYLFISGGSGITPLMSMLRAHHDLREAADIVFLHFARTPADIIFHAELEYMATQMPALRVIFVCESDAGWEGLRGRMSADVLAGLIEGRTIFNCGPAPFMQATQAALAVRGFDMRNYHEESFNFSELAPEPVAAAGGARFMVEFSKTKRKIVVDSETFILAAARAEGMRLPASCTKGICGTCKSRLVSGQVDMKHQGGIRQREIDAGMILLCCAKPLSDLVVER